MDRPRRSDQSVVKQMAAVREMSHASPHSKEEYMAGAVSVCWSSHRNLPSKNEGSDGELWPLTEVDAYGITRTSRAGPAAPLQKQLPASGQLAKG
jgi:hypothetical protein